MHVITFLIYNYKRKIIEKQSKDLIRSIINGLTLDNGCNQTFL